MTITFSRIYKFETHDEEHIVTFKKRGDGAWDMRSIEHGAIVSSGLTLKKTARRMMNDLHRRGYIMTKS